MALSRALLLMVIGFMLPWQVYTINITTNLVISICGDALVNAGEVCDSGIAGNTGAYGSSTAERICAPGCLTFGPYCGDSVLQVRFEEECNDGNNVSADLCSASCKAETPAAPPGAGTPLGGVPSQAGGAPGLIRAETGTRVVLRGKAYPNSTVQILLDGKPLGTVQADANADFLYSTGDVTPGTATFGFVGKDSKGVESIATSVIFEVVQSAVTTVANVFLPPTLSVSSKQIQPGALLTLTGQSVPLAKITTEISGGTRSTLNAEADTTGTWALQVDTASLKEGLHAAKAQFVLSDAIKSGYGRSVSFVIGDGPVPSGGTGSADINGDGKVNLVDFSIFLLGWGKDDVRSDFNIDGTVNLADFSIMLFNWTG
jgi:cysteine-rich repeat protein